MIRLTLDRIIKERGLSPSDIEKFDISRNTVKALVANANARIDYPTLDKLCRGLGVTPGDLIEYVPDEEA